MKRPVSLAVAALLTGMAGFTVPASAMTLEEALAAAYVGSPNLQAQRAGVRAANEAVPQALSGWRPTVALNGSLGRTWAQQPADVTIDPRSASATISQPIFRGFRTVRGTEAAENTVLEAHSRLDGAEQVLLADVAEAYSDVLRAQAEVELNANNEQVLRRQLGAARERFEVGEITRTDVSLAESRLSGATARRIAAEATLASARATFQRIVGVPPENLSVPQIVLPLPQSLDEAVNTAVTTQPLVRAADYAARAADRRVEVVRGELLPVVSVEAAQRWSREATTPGSRAETTSVAATVTVPLYQGGAEHSRLREAKHRAGQRRLEAEQTRVTAREGAVQAWEGLISARAEIESRRAQVQAASTALEGVQREAQVGARTVLDVLDAEQELLDANVALVRAQRNERVAAFRLLQSTGGLTPQALALPVEVHDPAAHAQAVRGQWIGSSPEADADLGR